MKTTPHKISLPAAIFINLNIILGTGIFINSVVLTRIAGSLGAAVYVLVGLLILPLIAMFSKFLSLTQKGTLYEFGAILHPWIGFFSSWTYFTGKLASAALGIHIFTLMLQQLSPLFCTIPSLCINISIVCLFAFLMRRNLQTGESVHYFFVFCKVIPLAFVILMTLTCFSMTEFTSASLIIEHVPSAIPLVLFAFVGFEAVCSLSNQLENPKKNGPRAIFISYLLTLLIFVSYQVGMFSMLGIQLGTLSGCEKGLPLLITTHIPYATLRSFLMIATLLGIALSALGSAYGILYSNIWNLYTLAEYRYTWFSDLLIQKNQNAMPTYCIGVACTLIGIYLFLFHSDHIPLQQIAAISVALPYSFTTLAFIRTTYHRSLSYKVIGIGSIISCTILLWAVVRNSMLFGTSAYTFFGILSLIGLSMIISRTSK